MAKSQAGRTFRYEFVRVPKAYPGRTYKMHGSAGYVYKHHYVWWKHTGQVVPDGCLILFADGDPANCRFDNLGLAASRTAHNRLRPGKREAVAAVACLGCNAPVVRKLAGERITLKYFTCGSRPCIELARRTAGVGLKYTKASPGAGALVTKAGRPRLAIVR